MKSICPPPPDARPASRQLRRSAPAGGAGAAAQRGVVALAVGPAAPQRGGAMEGGRGAICTKPPFDRLLRTPAVLRHLGGDLLTCGGLLGLHLTLHEVLHCWCCRLLVLVLSQHNRYEKH